MADGRTTSEHPLFRVALLIVPLLLVPTTAVAASAPAASDQGTAIWPSESTFADDEAVVLVVSNNGSTPVQGTPHIEVHHCPIGQDVCSPYEVTVHEWTGEPTTLAPGETLEHVWNRTTDDGEPAPEGTYEAHLTWENATGSTASDTSPRFKLENGTGPPQGHDTEAPRIDVRQPAPGATEEDRRVHIDVRVTATEDLESVEVRVDDQTVSGQQSIRAKHFNATTLVDLDPGTHVLEVTARDEAGRANRTSSLFTVAPPAVLTAGPLTFEATRTGDLDDVAFEGQLLFDRVTANGEGAGFRVDTSERAVVLTAPDAVRIEHGLADGWTATPRGQGVLLSHASLEQRLILFPTAGSTLEVEDGRISASMAADGALVLRPVATALGDARVADAILAGNVGAEIDARDLDAVSVQPYQAVNVSLAAHEGRLAAILEAQQPHGRTFVLDLGSTTGDRDLSIELDGRQLARADSLSDALDASDDAGRSEAYVVEEDGQRRVVVSVASFSARELVIEAAEDVGAFLTPAAVAGAIAVTGAAAWALFRRPEA